jgi:hypothetical protein
MNLEKSIIAQNQMKDKNRKPYPSGRDLFRLHKPGNPIGCIAAKDKNEWDKMRDLIAATKTTTISGATTPPPCWKFWGNPTKLLKKYGTILVVGCGP